MPHRHKCFKGVERKDDESDSICESSQPIYESLALPLTLNKSRPVSPKSIWSKCSPPFKAKGTKGRRSNKKEVRGKKQAKEEGV